MNALSSLAAGCPSCRLACALSDTMPATIHPRPFVCAGHQSHTRARASSTLMRSSGARTARDADLLCTQTQACIGCRPGQGQALGTAVHALGCHVQLCCLPAATDSRIEAASSDHCTCLLALAASGIVCQPGLGERGQAICEQCGPLRKLQQNICQAAHAHLSLLLTTAPFSLKPGRSAMMLDHDHPTQHASYIDTAYCAHDKRCNTLHRHTLAGLSCA